MEVIRCCHVTLLTSRVKDVCVQSLRDCHRTRQLFLCQQLHPPASVRRSARVHPSCRLSQLVFVSKSRDMTGILTQGRRPLASATKSLFLSLLKYLGYLMRYIDNI